MSDRQKHREAMGRKCLEAMSAKGLTFKSFCRRYPFIAIHNGGGSVGTDASAPRCRRQG